MAFALAFVLRAGSSNAQRGADGAATNDPIAQHGGRLARGRLVLEVSGSATIHFDSPYRAARAAWGLHTYVVSGGPILEIGSALSPRVTVGAFGYVGFGDGGSGRGTDNDTLSLWSAGVWARFYAAELRLGPDRVRFGVQFDSGAMVAAMQFRGETYAHAQARWGGAAIVEYGARAVAFHARGGVVVSQWPDAGGQGIDQSFSGVTIALGVSVRP